MFIFRRNRKLEFVVSQSWKNVVYSTTTLTSSSRNTLDFINSFSSTAERRSLDEDREENQSFSYSYLINSCGLSPKIAKSASKRLNFDSPEKPDSVLTLLRKQELTDDQISRILKRRPTLLLADPETVLLPKIQFLRSKGASSLDLASIFSNTNLLERSLDKCIIPCYNALKRIGLNDVKVLLTLKRGSWFSINQVEKNVALNISVLRKLGMPQSLISSLLSTNPSVICLKDFDDNVMKLIELGFDPLKYSFVDALLVSSQLSNETMKFKMEVYKRWGLSEDAIWSAFKKNPNCFKYSERKIMSTLEFLVNKMNFQAKDIVPHVLTYSLEKRIIPRCLVIRVLQLKGLITNEFGIFSILRGTDDYFLSTFVVSYMGEVPQLLDIFQGKTTSVSGLKNLQGCNIPFQSCCP